jgi:hypothetical protein
LPLDRWHPFRLTPGGAEGVRTRRASNCANGYSPAMFAMSCAVKPSSAGGLRRIDDAAAEIVCRCWHGHECGLINPPAEDSAIASVCLRLKTRRYRGQ